MLRGERKDLPRFFAYFTNDRALVVNPLFFPIEDLKVQPRELRDRYVESIGFETTESGTIRNLSEMCDMVRARLQDLPENQTPEGYLETSHGDDSSKSK